MNTLDRAREMVRRKFEEGVDVSEIKTYLIAYYGSTLPEIAIMAYHGNERIDAMLIVAARYWVRANSKIAD